MWQNPELVFTAFEADDYYSLFLFGLDRATFPPSKMPFLRAAHNFLTTIYEVCQEGFRRFQQQFKPSDARRGFNQFCRTIILEAVKKIGTNPTYLVELRALSFNIDWSLIVSQMPTKYLFEVFIAKTVSIIHRLMGSETEILVGGFGGQPVWLTLEHPLDAPEKVTAITPPGVNEMNVISQDDVDLVAECLTPQVIKGDLPHLKSIRPILNLLEDAYANSHFTVNPHGAYVLVSGLPNIKAVTLKVKQPDEKTLCFLAKIDHDSGSMLFGVSDIMSIVDVTQHTLIDYPRIHFLLYLVVQIYHDLVTARKVHIVPKRREPVKPTKETRRHRAEDYRPRYIYIPRAVYGRQEPPRVILPKPLREYTPRYVRGHFRRSPMTVEHRQAISEFEQQYGIQVLTYLPEGCTYVRPHLSPSISPEEFGRLPIYIKARIQDDIKSNLEKSPNTGQ